MGGSSEAPLLSLGLMHGEKRPLPMKVQATPSSHGLAHQLLFWACPCWGKQVTHLLESWASWAKVHPNVVPPRARHYGSWSPGPCAPGVDPPNLFTHPLARADGKEDQPQPVLCLEPCEQPHWGLPCLGPGIVPLVPRPRDTQGDTQRKVPGQHTGLCLGFLAQAGAILSHPPFWAQHPSPSHPEDPPLQLPRVRG